MAHTKTYYVLILFLTFFFVGCKKMSKEYTTVEFSITNPADGTPFVGVPVQLYESESKNKGISSEVFMEGITDNEGKAVFVFKAAKRRKYWYIPMIDESYFGPVDTWEYLKRPAINWDPIEKDQYNEARYEITYYAYLRDEIKNVNCQGATDSLFLHRKYLNLQFGSKVYDGKVVHPGCYEYYTTSIDGAPTGYRVVFMGTHIYNYEVHRGGVVSFGSDTVKLGKGEYGTIKAYY